MEHHISNRLTPEGKQKVALVDIDETICFYPGDRRYDLAEPHQENIDKINKLYDEGWKIVYWTARGSVSHKDYWQFTYDQLVSWGCKFHDLMTGQEKMHFDLVVDDKAKRIEEVGDNTDYKEILHKYVTYMNEREGEHLASVGDGGLTKEQILVLDKIAEAASKEEFAAWTKRTYGK